MFAKVVIFCAALAAVQASALLGGHLGYGGPLIGAYGVPAVATQKAVINHVAPAAPLVGYAGHGLYGNGLLAGHGLYGNGLLAGHGLYGNGLLAGHGLGVAPLGHGLVAGPHGLGLGHGLVGAPYGLGLGVGKLGLGKAFL